MDNIFFHPSTLREIYSHYVKSALPDDGSEIVLVLPFLGAIDYVCYAKYSAITSKD